MAFFAIRIMKLQIFAHIIVAIILASDVSAGDPNNSDLSLGTRALEIYDACWFHYDEIHVSKNQVWVLGRLTAQSFSEEFVSISGRFVVMTQLLGRASMNEFEYRWGAMATGYKPPFFVWNKAAICRINADADDRRRFRPVYLIPEAWTNYVVEGFREYQQAPQVYQTSNAKSERKKMLANAAQANPFLAIASFRALASADLLDDGSVRELLTTTHGELQAAFVCISLQELGERQTESVSANLVHTIENAKTLDNIRWITLGANAAQVIEAQAERGEFPPIGQYNHLESNIRSILDAVGRKLDEFSVQGETNLSLRGLVHEPRLAYRGR